MLESLAQSIDGSAINVWVMSVYWLWPLLEIFHFIGLSLLMGGLIIIDLRLADYFRAIDLAATHRLLPWVGLGFVLNLITGVLFFCGDPYRYSVNIGFQVKLVLIVIAGLNALYYLVILKPQVEALGPHDDTPMIAKSVAFISLIAWSGVLLLGRLIPYIGTG